MPLLITDSRQELADMTGGGLCALSDGTAGLRSIKPTHTEVHGHVLILSVDDEPTNHMVIEEALRGKGHTIHQVCSSSLLFLAIYRNAPSILPICAFVQTYFLVTSRTYGKHHQQDVVLQL